MSSAIIIGLHVTLQKECVSAVLHIGPVTAAAQRRVAPRQQKFTAARGVYLLCTGTTFYPVVLYPGRVSPGDARGLSYDLIAFWKVIGPHKLGAL